MTSPTARTLAELRKRGYLCDVTERWIPGANIRRDWAHLWDVIACRDGQDAHILGIQCTSASNLAKRVNKVAYSPALRVWKAAGGRGECWGWSKKGSKGKRKVWEVRVVQV